MKKKSESTHFGRPRSDFTLEKILRSYRDRFVLRQNCVVSSKSSMTAESSRGSQGDFAWGGAGSTISSVLLAPPGWAADAMRKIVRDWPTIETILLRALNDGRGLLGCEANQKGQQNRRCRMLEFLTWQSNLMLF
ncbi:MAG: hypothetical protein GY768_19640 [Planctomycetaceae bacterium]|nr:hypothetical protein [Planctomycetaceae bacterium]